MKMKRFAAIASAIGAIGAVAASSASADPPNDQVTGHGSVFSNFSGPALDYFWVAAHSGPLGENPQGHLRIILDGSVISGQVRCLFVFVRDAVVGIDLPGPPGGNEGAYLMVRDFEGLPFPDRANIVTGPAPTFASCASVFLLGTQSVEDGDVRVHDANP
jgi:hypothetical protein